MTNTLKHHVFMYVYVFFRWNMRDFVSNPASI